MAGLKITLVLMIAGRWTAGCRRTLHGCLTAYAGAPLV
jgi:hypothetical protein